MCINLSHWISKISGLGQKPYIVVSKVKLFVGYIWCGLYFQYYLVKVQSLTTLYYYFLIMIKWHIYFNAFFLIKQSAHHNMDQMSLLSTLSRSAVDITADGKVLRMCTLILDPTSPLPSDSEFGFDLVTKVGGGLRTGDYYIDTVDEESPASVSGLKSGDRLVEVDGIDVKNKTFEQVVQLINEAKLKLKLKLLVYPSVVINYGNPSVANTPAAAHLNNFHALQQQQIQINEDANNNYYYNSNGHEDLNKSMPDLAQSPQDFQNRQHYEFSKNLYKPIQQSRSNKSNDYDSIYAKKNW